MALLALLVLLACAAAAPFAHVQAAAADFALAGPCGVMSSPQNFTVPPGLQRSLSLPSVLPIHLTIPDCPPGADLPFGRPFPVLYFYDGFACQGAWYWRLVERAASWGLVVVQYDLSSSYFERVTREALCGVTPADEAAAFPHIAQWVAGLNGESGPLRGLADPSRTLIGGHSRGAKTATLIFANEANNIQGAYLLDPVDIYPWFSPTCWPKYFKFPSAAKKLAASGRAVGMSVANITTVVCNPPQQSSRPMWDAAGSGSWLVNLAGVSHLMFADTRTAGYNRLLDDFCLDFDHMKSREEVAALTMPPMLTWLWTQLNPQQGASASPDSPLPAFCAWLASQEQTVPWTLTFAAKGVASPCSAGAAAPAVAGSGGEALPAGQRDEL